MTPDGIRLGRLKRLEKLRAIVRQGALAEAGRAEARLARLQAVAERTAGLIDEYAGRNDAACGADLVRQRLYLGELHRLAVQNSAEVAQARAAADARAAEAAAAERSRAAVEDRAAVTQARITRQAGAAAVPLGARPGPTT
jgi:hypothetical protein